MGARTDIGINFRWVVWSQETFTFYQFQVIKLYHHHHHRHHHHHHHHLSKQLTFKMGLEHISGLNLCPSFSTGAHIKLKTARSRPT